MENYVNEDIGKHKLMANIMQCQHTKLRANAASRGDAFQGLESTLVGYSLAAPWCC